MFAASSIYPWVRGLGENEGYMGDAEQGGFVGIELVLLHDEVLEDQVDVVEILLQIELGYRDLYEFDTFFQFLTIICGLSAG